MADRSDFYPDPREVLADFVEMSAVQFWATYPSIRAVVPPGFGEAGDLLRYLGNIVVARRRNKPVWMR